MVLNIDTKLITTAHALPVLKNAATWVSVLSPLTTDAANAYVDKLTAGVPDCVKNRAELGDRFQLGLIKRHALAGIKEGLKLNQGKLNVNFSAIAYSTKTGIGAQLLPSTARAIKS